MKKVCFETFGCRLNRAEALQQEADYLADGWTRTESHSDADLIIVRGCSVTARAQRDCEKLIEHIKAKYPLKRVLVTGCLDKGSTGSKGSSGSTRENPKTQTPKHANTASPVPVRTARAYLKVQDGCNGSCTFCIVPKFRGKSASVDFDAVLDKARAFIASGYQELVVTGCNLSLYHSQGHDLADLVAALAELQVSSGQQPADSEFRIRLGSLEPSPVALKVLDVMAAHENVCRFLHIPIQSGSSPLLAAMKRPYDIRKVDALVRRADELMPGIAISCDLMAGFPGETELDQTATVGLLSRLPVCKVHVFPYSERPGTVAAALPGAVPKEIRHARACSLVEISNRLRTRYAKRFLGKVVEMVVEDEENGCGWTSEYLWCVCGGGPFRRKSKVKVHVSAVRDHMLIGEPA
jgi:threonylcarbamoyladenosine tRNA methylthiotransferase MtaB